MKDNWFEVSKAGLSQAFGESGFTNLMFELIQNSLDADSELIDVGIEYKGRKALFYVADDGSGIEDLASIYTVFGKSTSKSNPEKRGRFCIGDKLLLARCETATVTSVSGTLIFDENRRRTSLTRERGTIISGTIKCTKGEFEQFTRDINNLLLPVKCKLLLNGQYVPAKNIVAEFESELPTVVVNEDHELRRATRKTTVSLYEADGQPFIYEMGIPVCEASCPYHVNIHQKVPLSMDRTKLPESFLKTLHALVLNHTIDKLSENHLKAAWVAQATSSKYIEPEAMKTFMDKRFGEQRVAYDPSDAEANNKSVAKGYTLITGGSLNGEQWDNAKKFELVTPAGKVFPTPKPFHPDGSPLKVINPSNYTKTQREIAETSTWIAAKLIGAPVEIILTDDPEWRFGGAYGRRVMHISVISYPARDESLLSLLLHELGHEYESNHLAAKFHEALTHLGARLAKLVNTYPGKFNWLN